MDTAYSNESSPIVREANLLDAEVIADFNVQLAFETEGIELDAADVSAGIEAILNESGKGLYYVVEVQHTIVGCLGIQHEWVPFHNGYVHWISNLYIHPDHRRRGCFRLLYNHVRDVAVKQGALGIRLYADKDNANALQTYHKLGMIDAYKVHGMGDLA